MSVAEVDSQVEAGTLTKHDIKMLREADVVVFRLNCKAPGHGEGVIDLTKRSKSNDPWRMDEGHYAIACKGRVQYYRASEYFYSDEHREVKACAIISSAQYSQELRTVLALLRAGDRIEMDFVGNNSNQYTRDAGLYNDEMRLRVFRGKQELTFVLCHGVCKDNSARMIRRA